MNESIRLLDSNLGISTVMQAETPRSMPEAKPLPATALRELGLEELYGAKTTDKLLEQALCPSIGDGTVLQPAVFSNHLKESLESLKDNRNPAVRSFVSGELAPLLENESLLGAYEGLLVGG